MIVQVRAFANFRAILGRDLNVNLKDGSTVKDLLDNLSASYHGFRSAVFDESGQIKEYVILMKNRKNIDSKSGLKMKLSEGDEVAILPPIAGG